MALEKNRKRTLWLDFWGAKTTVSLHSQRDFDHLIYYFGDHSSRPFPSPDVSVHLRTTGDSFLESKGDEREVYVVEHRTEREWTLRGRETVTGPTPIPPFALYPLRDEVRAIHGAAAVHPADSHRAVVLHGPSTAGKSTILLALLERSWAFMSDDIIPIHQKSQILRFCRPIGVREKAAEVFGLPTASFPKFLDSERLRASPTP